MGMSARVILDSVGPLEHPAKALTENEWHIEVDRAYTGWKFDRVPMGNFYGWKQFRKTIEHEHNAKKLRAAEKL